MLSTDNATFSEGPRELIARLAAAVLIADGQVNEAQLQAVDRLRELGLGPLSTAVDAEVKRAVHTPIDVARTAAALAEIVPQAGKLVVSALAEIAASDRQLSRRELEVLTVIAEVLGLNGIDTAHAIRSAATHYGAAIAPSAAPVADANRLAPPLPGRELPSISEPIPKPAPRAPSTEPASALPLLGLGANATAEEADAAYAALVCRYNPAGMIELGPEFAVLAVQKLSAVTAAYVAARHQLAGR